ncbi:MAG: ATP-dependent DNA helicase [Deltaproteobacteria bacterium]|nr:ATP-dependent DNA helicase [Deltaproteobacteria bacterium]
METHTIKRILGKNGSLARTLEGFEYRPSQMEMAHMIEASIEKKVPLIIEAGTGIGKTLGYLVPMILSGKKGVISTGTKNLQEQIFFKDIPMLSKAIGKKVDALLMKGRKNYLCINKYERFLNQAPLFDRNRDKIIKRINKWLGKTKFADRAELSWLADDDPVWNALSADSSQCLGSRCIHNEECYINKLRYRAIKSDIIVVNHHLFFADLMVKTAGFGEIIPRFQIVLFDEAHNLEDIATTYFGESLSSGQILDFVRDVEGAIGGIDPLCRKEFAPYLELIRVGNRHLTEMFSESGDKGRLEEGDFEEIEKGPASDIKKGLNFIRQKSGIADYKDVSYQFLASRALDLEEAIERIFICSGPGWLDWYEKTKRGVTFHSSPLDISSNMRELLFEKVKTSIFTSATLSTNGSFDYIRARLGLPDNTMEGIFSSHFSYKEQVIIYIPKDLPAPNDGSFPSNVASRIKEILEITSGKALILFTSYNNLNQVHGLIAEEFPFAVYKQGESPRTLLLDKFRKETDSVLLATGSFWQGVDVPGDSLSCLIIDKLPFDSPGDPLVAARIESIRFKKGNPFMKYQLPAAIIAFKQGFGRLIRNSSDRGIFSILDNRVITSGYGHFFLENLPEDVPVVHKLEEIKMFFHKNRKDRSTEDQQGDLCIQKITESSMPDKIRQAPGRQL